MFYRKPLEPVHYGFLLQRLGLRVAGGQFGLFLLRKCGGEGVGASHFASSRSDGPLLGERRGGGYYLNGHGGNFPFLLLGHFLRCTPDYGIINIALVEQTHRDSQSKG